MTTTTLDGPIKPEVRLIPLDQLRPGQEHGRDQNNIEELAQSMKASGQLEPAIARPVAAKGKVPGHYQLAAGHRRFTAAKRLGWTQLACIVREMDDATFAEVRAVDNLQRENLPPLMEADEIWNVLQAGKSTVPQIAARLGRTPAYIYDRLRLRDLTPDAKRLVAAGTLPLAYALVLAKLPKERQTRILGTPKRGYDDGYVFRHDADLWDPMAERKGRLRDDRADYQTLVPRGLKEVQRAIQKHVRFRPEEVKDLGIQIPETAGQLAALDSRNQSNPAKKQPERPVWITFESQLGPDARDDKERTYTPATWRRAKQTCKYQRLGVVVAGPRQGEAFMVCVSKTSCRVHWASEINRRAKAEKQRLTGKPSPQKQARDSYEEQLKRQEAERAKRQAELARWKKATPAIAEAIEQAVAKLGERKLVQCAIALLDVDRKSKATTLEALIRAELIEAFMPDASYTYATPWDNAKDAKQLLNLDLHAIVNRVAPKEKQEASQ